jgi:phosphatidylglycerol:prolipoprotein diacylglycerol transferase
MQINGGDPVHPLFLYESLWMVLGLVLVLIYQNKKKRHGEITAYYLIWYSGARAFLETLRDSEYVLVNHGIAISFWMAILTAVVGELLMSLLLKKDKKKEEKTEEKTEIPKNETI